MNGAGILGEVARQVVVRLLHAEEREDALVEALQVRHLGLALVDRQALATRPRAQTRKQPGSGRDT
jgi:hypothetical protein